MWRFVNGFNEKKKLNSFKEEIRTTRGTQLHYYYRRRVSSVVEHSSTNPKVLGSIPGPVSYRGHGL